MSINQKTIILCLLIVIAILSIIIIIKSNKKNKPVSKKNENYRYQFSALSNAEKGAKIAEKIQQGYDLYIKIKENIPKIKNMLETLTNWDKLKSKMCLWASENQLISGLIAIVKKALESNKIKSKPILSNRLEKLKTYLYRLQAVAAAAKSVSDILTILPISDDIKNKVNTFSNIDKNLLELLKQVPGFGSC
jgi:hypothetical protein